ncbi:hypothetical protein [Labrys monachus]|uniref:Uncharacterized protein n=1 Tax=Labrys monachus TaxID=217067 RepID=A0ABU0FI91_9HYPH|nr:hypothetical protein [Labrys monachus]MDQ0394329.1 hypothetical protein [Labrys monachus]
MDIEPAIFNVAVDAYGAIQEIDISPWSEAFQTFEACYGDKEENGREHGVTGNISSHAGNVGELLRKMHASAAQGV